MKPKLVVYEDKENLTDLCVDTGFLDCVSLETDWQFPNNTEAKLNENQVKQLVEQLTTWLGYKAMENG